MPPAARLGDNSFIPACAHGCPACPHPCTGPLIVGSPTVLHNGLPAGRVGDMGIHTACCGPNTYNVANGSSTVFINGKMAARLNDPTTHCGGSGNVIAGSPNIIIGG